MVNETRSVRGENHKRSVHRLTQSVKNSSEDFLKTPENGDVDHHTDRSNFRASLPDIIILLAREPHRKIVGCAIRDLLSSEFPAPNQFNEVRFED